MKMKFLSVVAHENDNPSYHGPLSLFTMPHALVFVSAHCVIPDDPKSVKTTHIGVLKGIFRRASAKH